MVCDLLPALPPPHRIFFGSDDPRGLHKMRRTSTKIGCTLEVRALPDDCFELIVSEADMKKAQQGQIKAVDWISKMHNRQGGKHRNATDSLCPVPDEGLSLITTVCIFATAEIYIGTFSSNLDRVAYLLAIANGNPWTDQFLDTGGAHYHPCMSDVLDETASIEKAERKKARGSEGKVKVSVSAAKEDPHSDPAPTAGGQGGAEAVPRPRGHGRRRGKEKVKLKPKDLVPMNTAALHQRSSGQPK